jgi:hypothetical protein
MILCPNCQHEELVGALFCSQCGAQLILSGGKFSANSPYSEVKLQPERYPVPPNAVISPTPTERIISLRILDNDETLRIIGREEVTLGRIGEGQPIIPDIDLTPFKAYESGVSRLHASMKITFERVTIMDLDSANGTRLNDKKIPPYVPQIVSNEDMLTLGKLRILVLFNERSEG